MLGLGLGIQRGGFIAQTIANFIAAFKARVLADGGTFEAEQYLLTQKILDINAASYVYVPSSYKTSKLYALKPTNGSGDLTFARNSVAYRNNASNVLEQMAANIGRVNYVSNTPTLLVEASKTNLFQYSEEFNNIYWSKSSGVTVSADNTTAPNNTITADKIIESSTNGRQGIFSTLGGAVGTYTISVFAKNFSNDRYIRLCLNAGSTTDFIYATFDITTGTITQQATATNSNTTAISSTIISLTNGWYKLTLTGRLGLTYAIYTLSNTSNPVAGSDFGFISYIGNGTSGIYLWGAQLEQSTFATSYIPTTAAAVTKIADSNLISRTFVQNQTLYQSIYLNAGSLSDGVAYTIADYRLNSTNRITVYRLNNDLCIDVINSTTQSNGSVWTFATLTQNTVYKIAITCTSTGFKVFVNGVLRFTSAVISMPTLGAATLSIGCDTTGANQYNGSLGENYIYDYTMTDAEAVTRTT